MQVNIAHQALLNFSKKNAGIGIAVETIRRLIENQVQRLNSRFSSMESNQVFRNDLAVYFSGDFDTSQVVPVFKNFVNPNDAGEFFPVINLDGLRITISGFLVDKSSGISKKMVEIKVAYPAIAGRVLVENRRLVITLLNESHNETAFNQLWDTDPALRAFFEEAATYHFLPDDWQKLALYFKATSIFSGRDIAESLVDSLVLPDIFEVFSGIKFGENEKLGADATGEMLMFTADSQLNLNTCPVNNAAGQTQVVATTVVNGPGDITVHTEIDPQSGTLHYPLSNGNGEMERSETGDIFLFTPIELLRHNFDIVKPSVTASDNGRFGPIRWRYSVTAAVESVTLSLIRPWPVEFRLSMPLEVTGQAGAGIKIGCIRYEAVGAMFDGKVTPFDVNFMIYLDWQRRQIVFISKIENIRAVDFRFSTWPRLDFPISEILDLLLGKASEFVIKKQAGTILNVTRIPIANLDVLKDIADLIPGALAGATDNDGNVTMGVKYKQPVA